MNKIYNIGLIGFGLAGSTFHAPVFTGSGRFRLRAVVTSRAGEVHSQYPETEVCASTEELLDLPDIDAVVIASPNATHYAAAAAALKSGRHVVIDKPWVVSSQEGEELIALADHHNLQLSVYQNRRYDNDFLTLQKLIAEGMLGEIREYHSQFDRFRPNVRDRWREQKFPGSGILYDLGAHLIDQAVVLFGSPLSVLADVSVTRQGAEVDDYFHLQLEYPQTKVLLHSGCFVARAATHRFRVYGTKGSWSIDGLDPQEELLRAGKRPAGPSVSSDWGLDLPGRVGELCLVEADGVTVAAPQPVVNQAGDYTAYYRAFADAIDGNAAVPVDPTDALTGIKVIEAALQSARNGCRIRLK